MKIKWIVLLLFLFCISQAFTAPCGDVNSNGVIDIVDALMIARHYVGLNPANFDITTAGSAYLIGPGFEMAMIIENNVFNVPSSTEVINTFGACKGWLATGNIGLANDMNTQAGSVFTIPCNYSLMPASQVQSAVSSSIGGAGNTCTFQYYI